jgi:hydrogenase maturation protease
MDILILGIGNILLSDEGIGVRAVEALAAGYRFPKGVELLDGGTAGFELMAKITRREQLIVIDAIACDHPPGTVLRVEGEDVRQVFSSRISPHQLGISDVLAASALIGELPDRLVLFGIEPAEIGTSLELSAPVAAALPKLMTAVLEELAALGHAAAPKQTLQVAEHA